MPGKIDRRRPVKCLDQLFAQASGLQYLIDSKAKRWARTHRGMFPKIEDGTLVRLGEGATWSDVRVGNVKAPKSAVEKMLWEYHGDMSQLLDLCRQWIVFESVSDLTACLREILSDPNVVVERVKNGLDPANDSSSTLGFRCVVINMRFDVDFTRKLGLETHVCELQLLLGDVYRAAHLMGDSHSSYLRLRTVRRLTAVSRVRAILAGTIMSVRNLSFDRWIAGVHGIWRRSNQVVSAPYHARDIEVPADQALHSASDDRSIHAIARPGMIRTWSFLRNADEAVEDMGAVYLRHGLNLDHDETPRQVEGAMLSANLFEDDKTILNELGRRVLPEVDTGPERAPAAKARSDSLVYALHDKSIQGVFKGVMGLQWEEGKASSGRKEIGEDERGRRLWQQFFVSQYVSSTTDVSRFITVYLNKPSRAMAKAASSSMFFTSRPVR